MDWVQGLNGRQQTPEKSSRKYACKSAITQKNAKGKDLDKKVFLRMTQKKKKKIPIVNLECHVNIVEQL